MNRYPVGKPWDVLFIYRYKDLSAFGHRQEIIDKVRATLAGDPVWMHYGAIKSTVRSERENSIAQAIVPGLAAARTPR